MKHNYNAVSKEAEHKERNKMIKLGVGITTLLLLVVILLNCYTVVSVNHEASVESFGKVHQGKVLTGFNLVFPWWGIDEYSLAYTTENYDDLKIASKDKFKTNIDVDVTGKFIAGSADVTRSVTGTAPTFYRVHVEKRIKSCLTKAGGNVSDSQAFFDKSIQEQLATEATICLNDYLAGIGGYEVTSVQFSDIRLDPVVRQFMVLTKERQEAENQQASALEIANLKAQEVTKISAANLLASEDNKMAEQNNSDAAAYDIKVKADSEAYRLKVIASANKDLSKSLTPDIINYELAKRWNGVRSTHVLGQETTFLLK